MKYTTGTEGGGSCDHPPRMLTADSRVMCTHYKSSNIVQLLQLMVLVSVSFGEQYAVVTVRIKIYTLSSTVVSQLSGVIYNSSRTFI